MDSDRFNQHRLINIGQTVLVIGGMVLILGLSARLIFGPGAFFWTAVMVAIALALAPRFPPAVVMRLYRARPLYEPEAPRLFALLDELSRRAGLPRHPRLHLLRSNVLNAFAVGSRDEAAIAVTDSLLRTLSLRELAGVLAHEVSHIRHNDLRVMQLADMVSQLTSTLSFLAQILLLLNLPLLLAGAVPISWLGILLLIAAPTLSALLQLSLSRTREYHADLGACELTDDPVGLASALDKLERYQGGWLERLLHPHGRSTNPSLLRTHPPTAERIRRLLQLHTHRPPDGLPWPLQRRTPPSPFR